MAVTSDSGEVIKEFDFMVIKGTPKANTQITKGQVLVNNGEGYVPSTVNVHGPFFVALESAASAASPSAIRILKKGVVKLTAQATVKEGSWVIPGSNAGEVAPYTPKGTMNIIGVALEDVASAKSGKFLIGF